MKPPGPQHLNIRNVAPPFPTILVRFNVKNNNILVLAKSIKHCVLTLGNGMHTYSHVLDVFVRIRPYSPRAVSSLVSCQRSASRDRLSAHYYQRLQDPAKTHCTQYQSGIGEPVIFVFDGARGYIKYQPFVHSYSMNSKLYCAGSLQLRIFRTELIWKIDHYLKYNINVIVVLVC